jgi:hypothetical protein
MVGAEGFEPPASWSQTRRSTRLSYAPTKGLKGHEYQELVNDGGAKICFSW